MFDFYWLKKQEKNKCLAIIKRKIERKEEMFFGSSFGKIPFLAAKSAKAAIFLTLSKNLLLLFKDFITSFDNGASLPSAKLQSGKSFKGPLSFPHLKD